MKYIAPVIAALVSFEAAAQTIETDADAPALRTDGAMVVAAAKPARFPGKARLAAPSFTRGAGPAEGPMGIATTAPADARETSLAPARPVPSDPVIEDSVIELDEAAIGVPAEMEEAAAEVAGACMDDLPQVVLASAADFRADPAAWIADRAETPRRLLRDVRSITLSDPTVVSFLDVDLLDGMEPNTRNAIGIGVGRAARTCGKTDPESYASIETRVLGTEDNSFVEGYLLEVSRAVLSDSETEIGATRRVPAVAAAPAVTPRVTTPAPVVLRSLEGSRRIVRESEARKRLRARATSRDVETPATATVAAVRVPKVEVLTRIRGGTVELTVPFLPEFGSREVTTRNVSSVSPTLP